jgi:hypothetical protein
LRISARLEGEQARALAEVLASAGALPPPPAAALAALHFRLAPSRLSSALGWLPASYGSLVPSRGRPIPLTALAATSEGSWWLSLLPSGWRLSTVRAGGADPFPEPTQVTLGKSVRLWARTGPTLLVLGSSRGACQDSLGSGPGSGSASWRRLPRASVGLWVGVTDPLELVGSRSRAKAVAALLGLGEAERAAVAGARALLTALGELLVLAWPRGDALELELRMSSPFGAPPRAREAFRIAWLEKWRQGGFFSPEALGRLARDHGDTVVGRQAARLRNQPMEPAIEGPLVDLILWGIGILRGLEVPCARLSARLHRCLEAFGRQIEPWRWERLDRLLQLGEAGDEPEELRARARKSANAVGSHCDRRQGRLEGAEALEACLALEGCAPFASCLIHQLERVPEAPRRRP